MKYAFGCYGKRHKFILNTSLIESLLGFSNLKLHLKFILLYQSYCYGRSITFFLYLTLLLKLTFGFHTFKPFLDCQMVELAIVSRLGTTQVK